MQDEAAVAARWKMMRDPLNESQRRLLLGVEAQVLGANSISLVARAAGVNRATVRDGLDLVDALQRGDVDPEVLRPRVRVRREGGGRKRTRDKQPELLSALMNILESDESGFYPSPLLWTTRTRDKLAEDLEQLGFKVSGSTILELLKEEGFRVRQALKLKRESNWPDPRDQFQFINKRVSIALDAGCPVFGLEIFRLSRAARAIKVGSRTTLGLRRRLDDDRFADEVGVQEGQPSCDVCGSSRYSSEDLSEPTLESIEIASLALQRWWNLHGKTRAVIPERMVLVVGGLAGDDAALRTLRERLLDAQAAIQLRLEVLQWPAGVSGWMKIDQRFTLATNDYFSSDHLERHETILEKIGQPSLLQQGRRVKASVHQDGDTAAFEKQDCSDLFKDYPLWNYMLPAESSVMQS